MSTYACLPCLSRLWRRIPFRPLAVTTSQSDTLSTSRMLCHAVFGKPFSYGGFGRRSGLGSHAASRLWMTENEDSGRIRPDRARLKFGFVERHQTDCRSMLLDGLRCSLRSLAAGRRQPRVFGFCFAGGAALSPRRRFMLFRFDGLYVRYGVTVNGSGGSGLSYTGERRFPAAAVGRVARLVQGGWVSISVGGPDSLGTQFGSLAHLRSKSFSAKHFGIWILLGAKTWRAISHGCRIWDPGGSIVKAGRHHGLGTFFAFRFLSFIFLSCYFHSLDSIAYDLCQIVGSLGFDLK